MSFEWVARLPSKIFTRIENKFSSELKKEYGMGSENFSTVGSSKEPAVFPFVYVQTLPGVERNNDLAGKTTNACLYSCQVDVTDNTSQMVAGEIAYEVYGIMKSMGFEVISMPSFEEPTNLYRCTARYRRLISSADKF